MSLLSVLKTVGKDLSQVGTWIEDGLKVAQPIVGAVDPPLGAIFTAVETVINGFEGTTALNATQLQMIVTDISALVSKINAKPA